MAEGVERAALELARTSSWLGNDNLQFVFVKQAEIGGRDGGLQEAAVAAGVDGGVGEGTDEADAAEITRRLTLLVVQQLFNVLYAGKLMLPIPGR